MAEIMDLLKKLEQQKYLIIAEVGVNYYDIAKERKITPMEAAKLMCEEAHKAGVDAVKFQTYKAETIASKYSPSYWDLKEEATTSQYELFLKFDSFGRKEYAELAAYCKEIGTVFLSTPFDFESADYLDEYMDYYKISSSDITNLPFIKYIAGKNKCIMISTGASEIEEVHDAIDTIREVNDKPIILMHCVLEYPTPYEHASLNQIQILKREFPDLIIGYSDHTKPDGEYAVLSTAYNLGATVIEKHFTLNKCLKGNDHYHAMDVEDLRQIKRRLENIKQLRGAEGFQCLESEKTARMNARRSIVPVRDMKAGELITEKDVALKRPGVGISPKEWGRVIGKKLARDVKEDMAFMWEDICE